MNVQFPLGLAVGSNFCDREAERDALKGNIARLTHTWLTAPRRFGKTSLIAQTLRELEKQKKAPLHRTIDILTVSDGRDLDRILALTVADLVREIVPARQQALQRSLEFFKQLRPEIIVGTQGATLKFTQGAPARSPETVAAMLTGLDELAGHYKRRLVLVFDEFQRLAEIDPGAALEASVRHAVERAQHSTYLFSGSQRSLLRQMFEDKARPLFHLCARLELDRIGAAEYRDFLDRRAALTWSKPLSDQAFDAIVRLAQRHPYYMNKLCGLLWRQAAPPAPASVMQAWRQILEEERSLIAAMVNQLSRNQKRVFLTLASHPTAAPNSAEFTALVNLAGSSIRQAVNVLLDYDYICQDPEGVYRVLNPAAQSLLGINGVRLD